MQPVELSNLYEKMLNYKGKKIPDCPKLKGKAAKKCWDEVAEIVKTFNKTDVALLGTMLAIASPKAKGNEKKVLDAYAKAFKEHKKHQM